MNEETENELLKGSQERGEGSEVFMRWSLISEVENLGGEKGMGEVDVQSHHTHARTHTHTHHTHHTHTHTLYSLLYAQDRQPCGTSVYRVEASEVCQLSSSYDLSS